MVYNLKDSLLFETVSSKGKDFMENFSHIFKDAEEADIVRCNKQTENLDAKVHKIDISDAMKKIRNYDASIWDEISQSCLGCGICTYLCPTCHCFGMYDENVREKGSRIRVHDACMFSSFTREASGHNPRKANKEKMKQRIMHKFSYTVENFNETFCVGCGRCIVNCPVNLDIRETLTRREKCGSTRYGDELE